MSQRLTFQSSIGRPSESTAFIEVGPTTSRFALDGGREREREREREGAREREREEAPLALRAARPDTLGYIGRCDQEQGEIKGCRV